MLLCCRYGVLILVVELIGLTSVIPYGMLLPFQTLSSGSKGLPIDDGKVILPPEKRFRVHILVPCYKVRLTNEGGPDTAGQLKMHLHLHLLPSSLLLQPLLPNCLLSIY